MNTQAVSNAIKSRYTTAYRTIARFSGLPVENVAAVLEKRFKL